MNGAAHHSQAREHKRIPFIIAWPLIRSSSAPPDSAACTARRMCVCVRAYIPYGTVPT